MASPPFSNVLSPPAIASEGPRAELVDASATDLAARIRDKDISCRDVTRAYLDRIAALDAKERLNSYLTVTGEQALARAAELDDLLARSGPIGALHGVPIGVKDALDTAGVRTTGGMSVLNDWVPDEDATTVRRLKQAGAVLLGKLNLHEAGFGITSNNPHFGPVRNPYDPDRIPGGSSGGPGAAVAARLCAAAVGTDTGGSVRIPPALCGGVGFKPTLGRVSKGGMFCLSWTCDVNGPITRSVADAALLLELAAAGPDPRDPVTERSRGVPPLDDLASQARSPASLDGLRIGVANGYFASGNDREVDRVMDEVQRLLTGAGADLVEVTVPDVELATPAGFTIVVPEAVVLTEEYWKRADPSLTIEGQLHNCGLDVQAVFAGERGPDAQPVPAQDYLRARRATRKRVRAGFDDALRSVDVLLTPATPSPAVPIAESVEMTLEGEKVDTFTTFIKYLFCVSVAGLPAIAVPAGQTATGLPVGLQLVGREWDEGRLTRVAAAWEALVTAD